MGSVAQEIQNYPEAQQGALYPKMMKAIHTDHEWGNKIRMLKLPLILTDTQLYAGAIAQFYQLTKTLEQRLACFENDPLVSKLKSLNQDVTPGYEADLQALYGSGWQNTVSSVTTSATEAYMNTLKTSEPVELVAAAFILYGALVIGGGKQTQKKVKKVFPACDHVLFDVAEDMPKARKTFRETFDNIGKEFPEHYDRLVLEAKRFMGLNNTVVLSVRCLPFWWWKAASVTVAITAVAFATLKLRSGTAVK
jgi:heme oxygenase